MESFQGMLDRLFRDELEDLVMRYEALRTAVAQEINQRQGAVQHQEQQHLQRQVVLQQRQLQQQRYPTATITELPAEADSAASANVEEDTAVEGEEFLSPISG